MRRIRTTRQFERDLKRARKRGWTLRKPWTLVEILSRDGRLDPRFRPHRLAGRWRGFMECHVEPDWLLVWMDDGDSLVLARTGTHADLFG
ncbi:MAG: type II toxin-antitoxin system YafQ family toxin [Rhodospirillales bacterium]|nr:type II toxin-antitoxin system YafQ family toxin [Rhodospirillales bacterium]